MALEFIYAQPVKIYFGEGAFAKLGTVLEEDRRDAADLLTNGKTRDGRRHAIIWLHTMKRKIICVDMRCAFFSSGGKDYIYCSYYNMTSLLPLPANRNSTPNEN